LLEHPDLWNWQLGKHFQHTIADAYQATWPDTARRPSICWSLVGYFADSRQTPQMTGRSHGLPIHVGFRVLRDNLLYGCVLHYLVDAFGLLRELHAHRRQCQADPELTQTPQGREQLRAQLQDLVAAWLDEATHYYRDVLHLPNLAQLLQELFSFFIEILVA